MTACRCLAASDRTRASLSDALASARSLTKFANQLTNRASNIAPQMNSTISSRLLRAQTLTSSREATAEVITGHCPRWTGREAAGGGLRDLRHAAGRDRRWAPIDRTRSSWKLSLQV